MKQSSCNVWVLQWYLWPLYNNMIIKSNNNPKNTSLKTILFCFVSTFQRGMSNPPKKSYAHIKETLVCKWTRTPCKHNGKFKVKSFHIDIKKHNMNSLVLVWWTVYHRIILQLLSPHSSLINEKHISCNVCLLNHLLKQFNDPQRG